MSSLPNALPTGHPGVSLLERLGYDPDPIAVDQAAWQDAGFDPGVAPGDRLTHAGRVDEVELLLLDSADDLAAERVLRAYRSYNPILRPLVIRATREGDLELTGWAEKGRIGRLAVPSTEPASEVSHRLALIAAADTHDLGARLEVALSRESVSRRFFQGFSSAVRQVTAAARSQGVEPQEARSWAILFLSRILFLFFIQEKEWLDGDRRFLLDRTRERSNLLQSFFRPLFFECLNRRPARRGTIARRLGNIPYLNGGLFRPTKLEQSRTDLVLPDSLIRSVLSDVFGRFPFSVSESDDASVAIDPEMLGHVFESLMEEGERARTGSFYTPKSIVDQLVSRSLRAWLGLSESEATGADPMSEAERAACLDRLRTITVIDPACGSGAFLLAALREIERLRRLCGDERPTEAIRRNIVETSLFGIDVKSEAVALCELRLWLAIVSARPAGVESIASTDPLPNLDRNILQGNALLDAMSFQPGSRNAIYRHWRRAVRHRTNLADAYRTSSGRRRELLYERLRESDLRWAEALLDLAIDLERRDFHQIDSQKDLFEAGFSGRKRSEITARIEELEEDRERVRRGELDLFSYDVHFSQAMDRGGFDLVLGNPPWVRAAKIGPGLRETLRRRFEWLRPVGRDGRSPFPQFDLYLCFLEQASSIAHSSGVISMLVPAKLASVTYAERCRRELSQSHGIIAIDDWSRHDELFDADTFPIGLTYTPVPAGETIEVIREGTPWSVPAAELSIRNDGGPWVLLPPEIVAPLRDLWSRHQTLWEVLGRTPVMGVKTGCNALFFLEESELSGRGLTTPEGVTIPWAGLTRCIRGRDVRRWSAESSTWMLWPEESRRAAWLDEYARSRSTDPGSLTLAYVRPEHLGCKVAWKDIATRIEAVVIPDSVSILGQRVPLVPNQTLYCLDSSSIDETYLLSALLNSSVVGVLARYMADMAKDGHYRFYGRTIAALPWPRVTPADEEGRDLIRLARAAHGGTDSQAEIDRISAKLYGIDHDVLDALDRWR